jgi:hypothetical protein
LNWWSAADGEHPRAARWSKPDQRCPAPSGPLGRRQDSTLAENFLSEGISFLASRSCLWVTPEPSNTAGWRWPNPTRKRRSCCIKSRKKPSEAFLSPRIGDASHRRCRVKRNGPTLGGERGAVSLGLPSRKAGTNFRTQPRGFCSPQWSGPTPWSNSAGPDRAWAEGLEARLVSITPHFSGGRNTRWQQTAGAAKKNPPGGARRVLLPMRRGVSYETREMRS